MKRIILFISIAVLAVVAAGIVFSDQLIREEEYVPYSGKVPYTPSDMTKANAKFKTAPSTASWKTTDISKIKQSIVATFRGMVIDIDEPIDWYDNVGVAHGAIPITIDIITNTKNVEGGDYQRGDPFVFYVDSSKIDEKYYISSYEPEFEVGEDVIVHIARSHLGPMGENGKNYFVELGDFGKYKILDKKAYNEKHYDGRSIDKALRESQ